VSTPKASSLKSKISLFQKAMILASCKKRTGTGIEEIKTIKKGIN